MPRARPGRQPDRQHAAVRRVRVRDHDVGVRDNRRGGRATCHRGRGLLEPGARVSAGVRVVSHRVRVVPGRADQTSGEPTRRRRGRAVVRGYTSLL